MTIQDAMPTTGRGAPQQRRRTPRNERIRRTLDHHREESTHEFDETFPFSATEFVDPDVARRERGVVFGRVPSIVAHGREVPRPGDFVTLQTPRNRVIVERQRDGSVKSFVNVCRHRGAMLEEQEQEQEQGRCRKERRGLIWIVDDADAETDVVDWLGPDTDESLGGYGIDAMVAPRVEGFDEPVDGKIIQDAFLDGHHIRYAHPSTAAEHIHTDVLVVEDSGRHARFIAPRKKIDKFLEEPPVPDEDLSRYITETHFLGPNSTLLRGSRIAMASADPGGMVLGCNEVVDQIFRRELTGQLGVLQ